MSLWTLYWISVLPLIFEEFLAFIGITTGILGATALIAYSEDYDSKEVYVKHFKKAFIIFGIVILIQGFIPSERQMYIILGGYAATNVEGINKLPANLVGAANAYLEKMAKEVEPEKEKK